jgi:hypothetical protein
MKNRIQILLCLLISTNADANKLQELLNDKKNNLALKFSNVAQPYTQLKNFEKANNILDSSCLHIFRSGNFINLSYHAEKK